MSRGQMTSLHKHIFQRGQTLTWPRAQKAKLIEQNRITLVLNLWVKVDPDLSDLCRYVNWPMPGDSVPDDIDEPIDLVVATVRRQSNVLIHCEAGVNRSAFVAAHAIARLDGITGQAALNRCIERNPRISLRPTLAQHLAAYA